jgi:hypothetical protein
MGVGVMMGSASWRRRWSSAKAGCRSWSRNPNCPTSCAWLTSRILGRQLFAQVCSQLNL